MPDFLISFKVGLQGTGDTLPGRHYKLSHSTFGNCSLMCLLLNKIKRSFNKRFQFKLPLRELRTDLRGFRIIQYPVGIAELTQRCQG